MSTDRLALIEVAVESKMKADAGRLVAALTDLQGRNASVLASIGFESGQIILKGPSEAVLDQTIGFLLQD